MTEATMKSRAQRNFSTLRFIRRQHRKDKDWQKMARLRQIKNLFDLGIFKRGSHD